MDRTNRVFGNLTNFEEAYPDLQDVIVDYKQYMFGSSAGAKKDLPEHHSIRSHGVIHCTNPACNNGGFELDGRISEIKNGDTELQFMSCSGHEKMGGRQTRSCGSRIRYKIRLIAKQKD